MKVDEIFDQVIRGYAPSLTQKEEAVNAAFEAGLRFILKDEGLRLTIDHINQEHLREAALGAWNAYYEDALKTEFVVLHVKRKDLLEIGATEAQARLFTDQDMEKIAKLLGDCYVNYGDYWPDLGEIANMRYKEKDLPEVKFVDDPDDLEVEEP